MKADHKAALDACYNRAVSPLKARDKLIPAYLELRALAKDAARQWHELMQYQYTCSQEAMSALQDADNASEALRAALGEE